MTVAAAALYGFLMPLVEMSYKRSKQEFSYSAVLEYQFIMCLTASAFCAVGMIVNRDFQVNLESHFLTCTKIKNGHFFFLP